MKNKWVFELKNGEKLLEYKAQLVANDFDPKKGIGFNGIFSSVVKMTSVQVVLGLIASLDLEFEQLDVKNCLLRGDLEEEIHMVQPDGFEIRGKEYMICRSKKSLYRLKQALKSGIRKLIPLWWSWLYRDKGRSSCLY